jgi:hypothetical protein
MRIISPKRLMESVFPTVRNGGIFNTSSLDLQFARTKTLDPRITFTRASSGTYVGSDGLIKTATTNEARFDHNPTTGESLGLLVEEQRTNSITNNTMVGAVAGTPGTRPTGWSFVTASSNGLTISITDIGVENGINYIDYRFNGTTVASPNACAFGFGSATAATAQTWATSLYWKLASGTTTGITGWQLGIIENTSGGTFVAGAFYSQTAPTSAALITQRPTANRTLSGGATVGQVSHTMNIPVAGNTAIDFTIRLGMPQLEQGAFATSVIPTSTATVTRSADVASITGANFSSWYRQDEGTVFSDCLGTFSATQVLCNLGAATNTTGSSSIAVASNLDSSQKRVRVRDAASATQATLALGASSSSSRTKIAAAIKQDDFAASLDGGSAVTDASGTVPTVSLLDIGCAPAGVTLGLQTHRRLTYWPSRLPNSTLQEITR